MGYYIVMKQFLFFIIFIFSLNGIHALESFRFGRAISFDVGVEEVGEADAVDSIEGSDEDAGSSKQDEKKFNPILTGIDFKTWMQEDYRAYKLIFASGIVTMVAGTSMLTAGLVNYLVNFNEKTEIGDTMSIVLIGLGGGFMFTGLGLTIAGSVVWSVKAKADNPGNNAENTESLSFSISVLF